jgi:Thiol:disulfide interchange protein DsbD, N-terminal
MRLYPQSRHSRTLSLSGLRPNGLCWKTQLTVCLLAVFLLAPLRAQEIEGAKSPSVDLIRPGITSIAGGTAGEVQLQFRIGRGFHINSNTPKSEFLIPTTLKLDAPTDIVIGRVSYPQGEEKSFPFSPDEKLSVYTGDFTVAVTVRPLHTVVPGKYMFRGQLRYQACDNAACYPPKQLPVNFEVKVAKAATTHGRNPAQSPHVHH